MKHLILGGLESIGNQLCRFYYRSMSLSKIERTCFPLLVVAETGSAHTKAALVLQPVLQPHG